MDNSSHNSDTSQSAAPIFVFTDADSVSGLAALFADGRIKIYAHGRADIVVDVAGYCGDVALGFVATGSLQGCVVTDGNSIGLTGTATGGAGSPTPSMKNGFVYSNADTIEDLRGMVMCIGGGAGEVVVGGAEVCLGMNDAGGYNGTFSVYVSGGVGLEGLPLPLEGHVSYGYTGVTNLFSINSAWSSVWGSLCDFFDSGTGGIPDTGTTTSGTTIPS